MMNPNPFYTETLFGKDAKNKIKVGVDLVCDAAKITVGPKGRNVFIAEEWNPRVTNDGVTIVVKMHPEDKFADMGASIVKQACAATNDAAGDGTTTTAILLQSVVREGFEASENPMDMRNSLNDASEKVQAAIKKIAKPVRTKADIKNIAVISSESEEIGEMVSKIVQKVGNSGIILVEESQNIETTYDVVEGFEIPKGFISSYFANKIESMEAVYKNVPVLITSRKIATIGELLPLIEKVSKVSKEIVIFCDDIDNTAVGNLVYNKVNGIFHSVVVKCSSAEMEDLAALTHAEIVSEDTGITFENMELTQLGKAKNIIITEKKTLLLGWKNPKAHIAKLNSLAKNTKNKAEGDRYLDRVKKLQGKTAIIKAGAPVEAEMKYLAAKLEDAVQAVKAALDGGIVEGGGFTLYKISQTLGNTVGERILKKALQEPLRQIIRNAGKDESEIVGRLHSGTLKNGYNAKTDTFVNLLKSGIIDPAKVEIEAVKNAISAAGTLITTEVAICFKVVEKKN